MQRKRSSNQRRGGISYHFADSCCGPLTDNRDGLVDGGIDAVEGRRDSKRRRQR